MVVDILRGVVVLDDLVLHHAHAGFLHGHAGQGNPGLVGRGGRGQEDGVHLLLGIGGEAPLGGPYPGDSLLERLYAVNNQIVLFVHFVFLSVRVVFCIKL